jgi:hypothetical protein
MFALAQPPITPAYHQVRNSSGYPGASRKRDGFSRFLPGAVMPLRLLAQKRVHLGCGKGVVDIAEGAVFPYFLCRVE